MVYFAYSFGLTLIFALISPNMTIGDNSVFGTSTTLATTFFVLGSIAFIIAVYCYPKVQQFFNLAFCDPSLCDGHGIRLRSIGLANRLRLVLHSAIGWDVAAIHDALTDTTNPEIVAYYSLNQNNFADSFCGSTN